jgi:hypothetical protein
MNPDSQWPKMERPVAPTDESAVRAFEHALRLALPEPYRAFLLACNGGSPIRAAFSIDDWGTTVVNEFFGLNRSHEAYNLDWVAERAKHYLPDNVISIGADPGGYHICLGVSGGGLGWIYLADTSGKYKQLLRVASDFRAFLDLLVD